MPTIAWVAIVGVAFALALLAIVWFLRGSNKLAGSVKGPAGTGMGFSAQKGGTATVTGSKSHGGAITAKTGSGGAAKVDDSEAAMDIKAIEGDESPKA